MRLRVFEMEFLGVQKLLSEKQMKFPSKGKKPGASLAPRRQLVPWDIRAWFLIPEGRQVRAVVLSLCDRGCGRAGVCGVAELCHG